MGRAVFPLEKTPQNRWIRLFVHLANIQWALTTATGQSASPPGPGSYRTAQTAAGPADGSGKIHGV